MFILMIEFRLVLAEPQILLLIKIKHDYLESYPWAIIIASDEYFSGRQPILVITLSPVPITV